MIMDVNWICVYAQIGSGDLLVICSYKYNGARDGDASITSQPHGLTKG